MPSGRIRGMAATHVLNKSILGFLSPLKMENGGVHWTLIFRSRLQNFKRNETPLCSYIRDHILWLFVEHLDACEHHATTHLLVQVPQDVVQSFSHLGVVQGHACGGPARNRDDEGGDIQITAASRHPHTQTHTQTY